MNAGPLEGVRVVEAGSLIAGPYCGQLLGDLGAEVIKIELPGVGDAFRTWGKHTEDGAGVWWALLGRNKKSVTLNLRSAAGQAVFRDLVGTADVLIENFRPGTLARWGSDPDDLTQANPRLIVAQVSGFGQTGPYAQRAGYASIGEAMGGLRNITGHPNLPSSRTGLSLGDSLAGIYSTIGVLAALHERTASGVGQRIDTSIYESVLSLTESLLPDYHVFGHQRERSGAVLPGIAPSNAYPTRDGYSIIIAANQDTVFKRLSAAMGMPGLANNEMFRTHLGRGDNMDALDRLIADWSSAIDADTLLALLHESGVPAGKINRASDILLDPQVQARQSVAWVEDSVIGTVPMPNVMPQLSRTPGRIRSTGPSLGAHTREVLQTILNYDDEKVASLEAAGDI
ncbi:CaiB/BaiF CoA transferase family protein [Glaciibacter superstes]|uniref:CaiB/BaiF CoA transferase family protein n=1 Tax=Glaciibacter superstes TaxID=501023 RepID=UPI0003B399C3|nr:CaiB/BaiF CoA-transferase family protein [Glaciibacter superstes]